MLKIPAVPDLSFRPEEPQDEEFLLVLYASTREFELTLVDWSDGQKQSFITQQFYAQRAYYGEVFAGSDFLIIEKAGEPVGRLYLNKGEKEIRIVDISLLPVVRSQGLGSAILIEIQRHAKSQGLAVGIHVERFNPAKRLYQRLGFETVEDKGVYFFMFWKGDGE